MFFTKEAIETAPDPGKLLLVQPRDKGANTQVVVATVLKAPLTLQAQAKPYLAWKGLLKAKVGVLPLSIVLIAPRRCLAYWDVTSENSMPELIKALGRSGFLERQSLSASVDRALRLRAYLVSYFPILRRAALEGLNADDRAWLLQKAEARWKTSQDQVAKRMWMKRIRRDQGVEADDIPPGESWSFPSPESVDSLISTCASENGGSDGLPDGRRRLKLDPNSEFTEDVTMGEPRTSVKRAVSRPASVADDDDDSADEVCMGE